MVPDLQTSSAAFRALAVSFSSSWGELRTTTRTERTGLAFVAKAGLAAMAERAHSMITDSRKDVSLEGAGVTEGVAVMAI